MPTRPTENLDSPRAAETATTSRPRKQWLVVGGVLACTSIVLVAAAWALLSGPKAAPVTAESRPVASPPQLPKPAVVADKADENKNGKKPKSAAKKAAKAAKAAARADDSPPLWASPTDGRPLNLGYLAPGAQLIAVLRPAALLGHPEAEKIRAALGPAGQQGIESMEQATIARLTSMDRLIIGGQVTSAGKWLVTYVVRTKKAITREALVARLSGATEKTEDGHTYWLANDHAYYLPSTGDGKTLVVAPPDAMADIIDLAGNPPPLRRDIERLLDHTDTDRQVTIIVAPNSLFSEGQSLFAGELERLRGPLFWFLGDELSGAALSMNWGDDFFLELIATPKLETTPEKASQIFAKRCSEIPDKLQQYVSSLNAQPYGREIVSRFPAMMRKLAAFTRSGFETDHAVLRCFLPVTAGHNLLMGAELTLAEPPGTASQVTASGAPANAVSLAERMAKVTSLRFAKDTLEAALEQLSQDVGVPIVIRGPDLQAEGITKNQSFGIDVSNKPAEEILVQILRLANPDKAATGPEDVRQKLVYIVEKTADKIEQIVVTTRAKAKDRHNELPAAFRAAKP
jgi:hypothetical protein